VNVRVGDREALDRARDVWEAVDRESQALAGEGRVLVRASGTEPLVRVMVEAPERARCAEIAARLAETVERELA
jgi:phosphoglucosamine mutase